MNSTPRPENREFHEGTREFRWSPAEKVIARKAFDAALQRELRAAIRNAQDRAGRIEQPSDLWELENYLTRTRLEIDRKYDYRYSVLHFVFAKLIREGSLREQELRGLGEEKLADIRQLAQ